MFSLWHTAPVSCGIHQNALSRANYRYAITDRQRFLVAVPECLWRRNWDKLPGQRHQRGNQTFIILCLGQLSRSLSVTIISSFSNQGISAPSKTGKNARRLQIKIQFQRRNLLEGATVIRYVITKPVPTLFTTSRVIISHSTNVSIGHTTLTWVTLIVSLLSCGLMRQYLKMVDIIVMSPGLWLAFIIAPHWLYLASFLKSEWHLLIMWAPLLYNLCH